MFDQNVTHLRHVFGKGNIKDIYLFFFLVFSNISKPTESEEENAKQRNVILTVQNKVVNYYQSLEKIF